MTAETSNARGELRVADIREDAREPLQLLREKLAHDEDGWAALCRLMPMLAADPPPSAPQQGQAVAECHCATCTCAPGMTPAVRFDTSPAAKEGAVRDHLIALGWTPPGAQQTAAEAQGGGDVVQRLRGVLQHAKMGNSYLISQDLIHKAIGAITAPPSAPVGVEWPLSLLRAGHWHEVYIGHRCMRLEVTYDYATWERLMAEVESALAQQPAAVDRARFRKAPCYLCGYNGAGYFQPETHPCSALYHAAQHQEPKS